MKISFTALALAASALFTPHTALAQTEIQWWHSMSGALGDWVGDIANDFNSKQKDYKIVPVFKGNYDESMTAAVAAFRAGNAPHILQVFAQWRRAHDIHRPGDSPIWRRKTGQ